MHGSRPVKPLSAYSLNEYGLGEADLLIQVHAILEQPCVPSCRVPNRSSLARGPIEVVLDPIVDPPLYVSMKSLALHADRVIKDMQCCYRTKELEVGEVEIITKLEIGRLRPLRTGPGCVKNHLLLRIACGVEESQARVTVLRQFAMRDGLEGALNKHGGFTMNTRGFRR